MAVVRATAEPVEMHGFRFTPLASPSRGTTTLAMWTVTAPPGASSPRHSMTEEEVLLVQRGRVVAHVGDASWELAAGDGVVVPPGEEFLLDNPFDEPADLLACTTAGMRARVGGAEITPPWAL
ncbi:quercetin dioxygenase-like cupin family protein [Motilibacter rhizosphaerae]|uniref:Quercetin dioxygenase-like cupin family protein n=1 Tax=Motilibacter rhizosphaerae TaxID=598652 RepID=A0A4Q7NPF6_9ACTN|nr:cupin domain-containing protein [Motilibacter rhizosphaerae]RZS86846.1 quercetin dioxygenase-like cupin family protein [Motilibacter rhizosphaerae]